MGRVKGRWIKHVTRRLNLLSNENLCTRFLSSALTSQCLHHQYCISHYVHLDKPVYCQSELSTYDIKQNPQCIAKPSLQEGKKKKKKKKVKD